MWFWQNPEQTQATQQHDAYWDWVIRNVNWGGWRWPRDFDPFEFIVHSCDLTFCSMETEWGGSSGLASRDYRVKSGQAGWGQVQETGHGEGEASEAASFFSYHWIVVLEKNVFVLNRPPKWWPWWFGSTCTLGGMGKHFGLNSLTEFLVLICFPSWISWIK